MFQRSNETVEVNKDDPAVQMVYTAIRALAGMDGDGARQQNGIGFSKLDTQFGRSLAEKSWDKWSDRMVSFGYKMLRKYRVQLYREFQIEFDKIAVIPDPDELNKNSRQVISPFERGPLVQEPVKEVYYEPDTNEIVFVFKGLPRDVWNEIYQHLKFVSGAYFNKDDKTWRLIFNQSACVATIEVATKFEFTALQEDQDRIGAMAEQGQILEEASKAHEADFEVDGLGGTLRPFQKAGVKYLTMVQRGICADDMGLGKTIEAIATLLKLDAFPALVVCPASLKINWMREIIKWIHGINVVIAKNKFTDLDLQTASPDVLIINYENLMKNVNALAFHPWKAIVFDEAHRLKTGNAQRSQAAAMISYRTNEEVDYRTKPAELEKNAIPIRICLTGTPVQNRPAEVLNLLKIIGRVHDVSPKGITAFLKRYCGTWDGHGYMGATNTEELHRILRQTCMIRRMKTEVLTELPPVQNSIITFEIDNRKEYEKAEEDIIAWVGQEEVRKAHADKEFMASIEHLTPDEQLDAITARKEDKEARAARAERLVRIEKLKILAARGKMKQVKEWIEEFLEADEKLIVFANHIEIQKDLVKMFPESAMVLSEDNGPTRQISIDRFQREKTCRTIMCSLIAGGEGITLTAASNVAFVELGWTPSIHDQAVSRAHRMGQEGSSVTGWYFIAKDTIEEQIATLLDAKREVVNAVTDGRAMGENESLMEGIWDYLKEKAKQAQ